MENFEGYNVLYMLRQARMPFFHMGMYPAYTLKDGEVVRDHSQKTFEFQRDMRELEELMQFVSSRVERGMKVPETWKKKLRVEGLAAIIAAEKTSSTYKEWAEHYYRALRFLSTYMA